MHGEALPQARLKVAIVHDWLDGWRGGENVLAAILSLVPHADLFALVDFLDPPKRAMLHGKRARTSFLQSVPFARRWFRLLLPVFPAAVRGLDVRGYPLVISVSHAVAKNVRIGRGQFHLCYCLTPMRYAWDLRAQYLAALHATRGPMRWLGDAVLDALQAWDRRGAQRVTKFVAISDYIADRIRRAYDRPADVVYPPVDVDFFTPGPDPRPRDFYLTASRWVPYKRVDAIVAAFRSLPQHRLVVVGAGPDWRRVRAGAGPNVEFVGEVSRATLRQLMRTARAFIFAAEEDFGIVPLEAQACGTPVIAFARGAALETLRSPGGETTTVLFDEQAPGAIAAAVDRFERMAPSIDAGACRRNAERFSATRFRSDFLAQVRMAVLPDH